MRTPVRLTESATRLPPDEPADGPGIDERPLNDRHAFGLGEALNDVDREHDTVLPRRSARGSAARASGAASRGSAPAGVAGHVGHVAFGLAQGVRCYCGATGHIEVVAGGGRVLWRYRELGDDPRIASACGLFDRPDGALAGSFVEARACGR